MIVALDVGYFESAGDGTVGVCGVVGFESWTAPVASVELSVLVEGVAPYVSGRFFERELPCLIAGLTRFEHAFGEMADVVVIDGNVRLDPAGAPGLGAHVHRELAGAVPVVGVAKQPFRGLDAVEVRRGQSSKPLYVTSAGIDEQQAASHIASMAGSFRVPTMLKRADQLSRRLDIVDG